MRMCHLDTPRFWGEREENRRRVVWMSFNGRHTGPELNSGPEPVSQ